jgi:acyl-CoA synthetase (AMP-forming)/AMP-acid ligase II
MTSGGGATAALAAAADREVLGSIWSVLEHAERSHGSRPALGDGCARLDYARLAARVRARAADWRALGVGPGERIALLASNGAAFRECTFATAGLDAILVPLNHRLAPPELAEILRDAEPALVLCTADLAPLAEAVRALGAPGRWSACAEEPSRGADFRPAAVAPGNVAHLYYTSGTTGRPKGVMLTHRNVCTHAAWAVRELALGPQDRWGHFAPMFHLADAWATIAVTQVGGLHVFAPHFEPEAAIATIEREGVTLTNLVPTMLKRLVASPRARAARFASLRLVLSGGAPISPALVGAVLATLGCEYVQTYGMTETSPYLTLGIVPADLRALPGPELLAQRARTGRSFGEVELEVVDERGVRVPADDRTVGEIRVRGATVTPGYWRRPEETARAIRAGWLHTGDLAVVDARGSVNIVDRKKDMIVTGGENVYSIEVENALHEHPAVLECAVFGLPDETWGEAVHAAVVLRAGAHATPAELVEFVRARIAAYKAPRTLELLHELPKTGSGKISKQLLRVRSAAREPVREA